MGAGVFVGIFWGLVVSTLVVTVVSLSAPLPPRPGDAGGMEATDTAAEEIAEDDSDPGGMREVEAPADAMAGVPETDEAEPSALAALDDPEPVPDADPQTSGPAEAVPLPAGSEFNRPPPEDAPVLPGTDSTVDSQTPTAPEASVPTSPGGLDTAPAPQPEIALTPDVSEPATPELGDVTLPGTEDAANAQPDARPPTPLIRPEPDTAAEADAESVAPPQPDDASEAATEVASATQAEPETVPETEAAPDVAEVVETPEAVEAPEASDVETPSEPATEPQLAEADASDDLPPTPETPQEDTASTVETSDAGADEGEEIATETTVPAAEADPVPTPPSSPPVVVQLVPPQESAPLGMVPLDDLPAAEESAADEGAMPEPPRLLRPLDGDDDTPTSTRTLPQIVSPARNVPDTDDAGSTSDVPVASLDDGMELSGETDATDLPAIEAFAVPFDAPEDRRLIAVVLIDQPDERLDIETLTQFPFPVAFAIDPSRPDATERATIYREAGFEVLMLASVIPEGATASDTAVALSAARDRVPEAIALMDTPEARLQSDRPVLEATVGAAAAEGQGFVAFPRGLNTAEQMAARQGVPAATFFRLLDDEDQRATVITRFLGRAEFAAAQEGAVIVAGRTRPDTVTALFSWALGDRNEGVAIAPVSAVLQRLAE